MNPREASLSRSIRCQSNHPEISLSAVSCWLYFSRLYISLATCLAGIRSNKHTINTTWNHGQFNTGEHIAHLPLAGEIPRTSWIPLPHWLLWTSNPKYWTWSILTIWSAWTKCFFSNQDVWSLTSRCSCRGQALPGVRALKLYFTLAPKKPVSQFVTGVFNMPSAHRTLCPAWNNFCQQFLPLAAARMIFIRWSYNTVLAAIRQRKQEGTAAEVNNCSVPEWSSAMMEQVALLAAVAAGQSLDGEGRQGQSSVGEGVGAGDSKVWKSFLALREKKRWLGFLCITDSSSAKNFHKEDGSSEDFLEDLLLWNLCGGFFFFTAKDGWLESLLTSPLSAGNEHVFKKEPDGDGTYLLFQRSSALAVVQRSQVPHQNSI